MVACVRFMFSIGVCAFLHTILGSLSIHYIGPVFVVSSLLQWLPFRRNPPLASLQTLETSTTATLHLQHKEVLTRMSPAAVGKGVRAVPTAQAGT